jgi:acyl transferase domain-containing protein/acyl carrier protein
LRNWGIEPAAVVGHSVGEIAAACIAGALPLEEGLRVAMHRGRVMQRAAGRGKMLAVALASVDVEEFLKGTERSVSIAAMNAPRSTVISGDAGAIDEIADRVRKQGIWARMLPVNYAFHSWQMDPSVPELVRVLGRVERQENTIPIYSTVTGSLIVGGRLDAAYWGRNVREPVRFAQAIHAIGESGCGVFVEIGPQPVLGRAIRECLAQHSGKSAPTVVSTLRRGPEEVESVLGGLGELYVAGCEVKWEAVNGGLGKVVELPRYAWQRERYWIEGEKGKDWGAKKKERRGGHGLMGEGWSSAVEKGVHYWEAEVEVEHLAYLADHRVGEATVMPGAGYVEMAVGAAREVYGEEGVVCVEEMEFERAMVVMEGSGRKVQVVMREEGEGRGSVEIHSRGGEGEGGEWVRHARGRIAMSRAERWREGEEGVEEARERCEEALDAQEHYEELKKRSLDYGPSLRGVEAVWRAEREAVGRVRLRDRESAEAGQYWVHPALLDACFQLVAAAGMEAQSREAGEAERMYLPVAVKSVQMRGRAGTAGWGHAVLDGGPQSNGEVRADVRLVNDRGETVVAVRGLRFEAIERVGKKQQWREWLYEVQWRQSERAEEGGSSGHEEKGSWLLLSEGGAIAEGVRRGVQERAQRCVEVRAGRRYRKVSEGLYEVDGSDVEQMQRLLEEAFGETERCVAVVHLWGLGAAEQIGTEGELDEAQERGCLSVLHWVQALAHAGWRDEPRLWLVTRGAQAVEHAEEADGLAQATMWGLGRVVAHEHPELRCTRIDLDPAGDRAQGDVDDLLGELCSAGREDEIALRHHARFVPRLTPFTNGESAPLRRPAGERAYRLEIERTGVLDDLTLRATESSSVGPDEVEIEVEVAGLNFMDVLLVLGIVAPDQAGPITLGGECSGRVTAVGSRVQGLAVGDEVIAVAPFSFGRTTRTLAQFVVPKPNRLTFEQAASVPLVFMTAEYALNHLAHLQQGERVLIHAAAGGVGLAAVQLARLARAEIFATAGSDEKKAYLRDIGVTHVMNSRSLDFADEVLRATGGYGVDVILNSLAAGAVGKNLEILAPFGRFLEIGKRDIYGDGRLALAPFRKNLSYFAVDLARMSHERAHQFAALLRDVVKRFDSGELRPLPVRVFPISAAKDAFRFMQQSKHIGKIAITFAPERSSVPIALDRQPVDADATYWITGGLGGLGRKVARWMVERGARHLVLMGRGGGTEEARREVEALREGGAEVRVEVADVADEEELRGVVGRMEATMPRLRGVIHAAGVLDDGILLQQSAQRFRAVMAPKVKGAWNLHQLTRDRQLDFFVLFSSAASVVGSPGQGNYSAGNAFLDSLSAHRRALGLPCLTINWGPWSEVGMAVAGGSRRNGAPKFRDVSIDPRDGVSILEHLLRREARPTLVMPFHGAPWWEKTFRMAESPLLTDLVAHRGLNFQDRKLRNELLSLGPGPERRLRLENHLRMAVARVSGIEMERLTPEQSLIDLGLDSLMAVELENRLEATLGVSLSAAAVFNHPTISALATYVARRMELPADERDEARGIEELKGAAEDDEDTASILRPGSAFDDPRGSGVSVASGKDLA